MMEDLPKTDLNLLSREVQTAQAALPCNLSDYWLDLIARDLECMQASVDDGEDTGEHSISGPLYLILKILVHRAGTDQIEVNEEEMYGHFVDYQIEVGLEAVSRRSEIKAEPATLETIFTGRDVQVHRGESPYL